MVPAVEAVLVVILATAHPGGAAEHRRMRRIGLTVVGLLVVAALWATAVLVDDLVRGTGVSGSPSRLLASGAVVWLGNNLAFALLYWLMDGGGPVARRRRPVPIDFAFTQHMSPELAPPGWRPVFLDYLHLGFTNATAFSPTDVMPLTHRAKYAMLVQATVALALFGLVVARAVNAFTSSPVRSGGADLHPHEVMPRAGAVQSIGGPPPPCRKAIHDDCAETGRPRHGDDVPVAVPRRGRRRPVV